MKELQNEEIVEQYTEDRRWCVYIHTCKVNNKVYVGQTCKKPEHRWSNGLGYQTQKYFWRSIQRYGWDNFEHIIFADNLTKEEANKMESRLILLICQFIHCLLPKMNRGIPFFFF